MRSSVVISALVAVLVGFGGSVAIVLAAARAVGADVDQTSSWVAALCLSLAMTTAVLSVRHRMPIVAAWSTPGAALIATYPGATIEQGVAAFLLAAALILLTAAFRPIGDLIGRIPSGLASAMLAGVLFGFVVAVLDQLQGVPALVLPLVAAFVVLRLFSPAWAVVAALALGVALSYVLGLTSPIGDLRLSTLVWIAPDFDTATLIGLGLPLYLVTMASQNLPGFAVLRAAGYAVPTRSILTVTGLSSLVTAGAGAHTTNLGAIIAAMCTGEDAHPDKDKRWLGGVVYALAYVVLAFFGASLVTLFASFPEALIVAVAGIALAGPFVSALGAGMSAEKERFAAAVTFVVTASGITVLGIGAAFWGLIAGLTVFGLDRLAGRLRPAP